MTLHQVVIVQQDQLLCLLVVESVELREVVPEDLYPVLERKATREVERLALTGHGLCLLVLVIDIFI